MERRRRDVVVTADAPVPLTPDPDDKDWTWTISRPCPECGFDPSGVQHADVPVLIERYTGEMLAALGRPGVRDRPQPEVWSPLEYGCHVRDVCRLFEHRLRLMLDTDDPIFDNWDQDDTALELRYWEQDPAEVAAELRAAAASVAAAFARVEDGQWERPGRRSNGSVFTVDTFARYFLHDIGHHGVDVAASHDHS